MAVFQNGIRWYTFDYRRTLVISSGPRWRSKGIIYLVIVQKTISGATITLKGSSVLTAGQTAGTKVTFIVTPDATHTVNGSATPVELVLTSI